MTTGLTLINWLGRGNDIAKLVCELEDENKRLRAELDEVNEKIKALSAPDLRGNEPIT